MLIRRDGFLHTGFRFQYIYLISSVFGSKRKLSSPRRYIVLDYIPRYAEPTQQTLASDQIESGNLHEC